MLCLVPELGHSQWGLSGPHKQAVFAPNLLQPQANKHITHRVELSKCKHCWGWGHVPGTLMFPQTSSAQDPPECQKSGHILNQPSLQRALKKSRHKRNKIFQEYGKAFVGSSDLKRHKITNKRTENLYVKRVQKKVQSILKPFWAQEMSYRRQALYMSGVWQGLHSILEPFFSQEK